MKRIGPTRLFAAAALAVSCTAVSAQAPRSYEPKVPRMQQPPVSPAEAAISRGVPAHRVEPSGELAQPSSVPAPAPTAAPRAVPPRLVQNARRHERDRDVRHCLTATSNRAVHRCANRYRPRGGAAPVRKASAKPSDKAPASAAATLKAPAPAVEITRTPDLAKPGGPPRPGDTAKAADLVKPMDVTKPAATPKPVESSAKAAEPAKRAPGLPPMGSAADPTAAPPAKSAK